MELLPSQRAEVFFALEEAEISPSRVTLSTAPSKFVHGKNVPAVFFKGTTYYFAFDTDTSDHTRLSRFSPGSERIEEIESHTKWHAQLNCFRIWCENLNQELSVSDPWAELERQAVPFQIDPDNRTSAQQFNVTEFDRVAKTLHALQALLLSYAKDNDHQQAQIKTDIAKLLEGAKTQDRKGWFFMVVGFIASTAVSMALAPDQTKAVYEQLKAGLRGAIQLITN